MRSYHDSRAGSKRDSGGSDRRRVPSHERPIREIRHPRDEGDGSVRIVFSNRRNMSYAAFGEYLDVLRGKADDAIDWGRVVPSRTVLEDLVTATVRTEVDRVQVHLPARLVTEGDGCRTSVSNDLVSVVSR